jgi:uncharacterized BrkB/YihY/UPF0761 family membrane protein
MGSVPTRREQLTGWGRDLGEQLSRRAAGIEARFVVVRFGADLYRRYTRTNATLIVGSLAYRLFLFLIPSMLVVVSVAGFAQSSGQDAGVEVGQKVRLGKAVGQVLSQAGQDSKSGWQLALVVGLVGMLLGAYSLYGTLFRGFAQVWEVPMASTRKSLSTGFRFVGGLVFFLAFLVLMSWIRRIGPVLGTAGFLSLLAASLVLFVLMSIALPHRGDDWVHLVPGALVGGAGTVGIQVFTAVWLPNEVASRSATYGALGIAIALLAYLALLGTVLIVVPVVNATWFEYLPEVGLSERVTALIDRVPARLRPASSPPTPPSAPASGAAAESVEPSAIREDHGDGGDEVDP